MQSEAKEKSVWAQQESKETISESRFV